MLYVVSIDILKIINRNVQNSYWHTSQTPQHALTVVVIGSNSKKYIFSWDSKN